MSTAELGTIIDLPLKISNAVLIAKDAPPIKVLCDTTLGQMLAASLGALIFWGEASDEIANPRANNN